MHKRVLKAVAGIAAILAAFYLTAVGYLFVFQRDYVFEPGGTLQAPGEVGLSGVEEIRIKARDGVELLGWYQPAASGMPTVLYFHGNAGSLSRRAEHFRQITQSGFGLLAMSYRGYPGSGGSPSEAAFLSDALEIHDWLAERTDNIVAYGESLGTSVATYVASEREVRALVLEAPFTAALDMAAEAYPWVPVSILMRDPFLSREYVTRVDEPVLILHGTADVVVPVEHGRNLFEAAHEPKSIEIIEGGGHSDLWDRGLWEKVLAFLKAHGLSEGATT